MQYWKYRLRQEVYSGDYRTSFDRWERQIQVHNSSFLLPLKNQVVTCNKVRHHLNRASKELKRVQKNSEALHLASYYDLRTKYEADDNPATINNSQRKASIVTRTVQGENIRNMSQKFDKSSNRPNFRC